MPKKTPRKSQFNHLILDRRLVLVLGQNSEVCARLVDGMLADNAGTHMHVGKNHVYQQDKYLYQDYRLPHKKHCIPGLPIGRNIKSNDSAGTVVAILNHIRMARAVTMWHGLLSCNMQYWAAFGTLLKESEWSNAGDLRSDKITWAMKHTFNLCPEKSLPVVYCCVL